MILYNNNNNTQGKEERELRKAKNFYQLEKDGDKINHLMFMDDIKLFGSNKRDVDTLVQTVRVITEDMRMEFGIEKCALVNIERGKLKKVEGISLPNDVTIKEIEESGYKYLGVQEGAQIMHEEMKQKIKKEYVSRVRAVLKSKLDGGNTVTAINTWAVPVIRYSGGILGWRKDELRSMDTKTRKLFTIHRALHPRASVARLYLPRKEGGRGLLSVEDCVELECRGLGQYLKTSSDSWLRQAWRDKLIKTDEDPKVYKERMKTDRTREWREKPLHGQYIRDTESQRTPESWQWLRRGELKRETEGMLMAAQDQALRTNNIRGAIDGEQISRKCRLCKTKDETINHIVSECPNLAQKQYKERHDQVARTLHWSLSKRHNIQCSVKWYEHTPEVVVENEEVQILWDMNIVTDRVISARRPDIVVREKKEKRTFLIDVAIPWDTRVEAKEIEKITKYQDLRVELTRIWGDSVEVVPVVIRATGTIPARLTRSLDRVQCHIPPGLLQKSVLLGTAHILRRVLDIR